MIFLLCVSNVSLGGLGIGNTRDILTKSIEWKGPMAGDGMYDYMRALYCHFAGPTENIRAMEKKLCQEHERLSGRLEKGERKLLLHLMDLEAELRDEKCLNSFVCGYRLACGIQQELWTSHPTYCFDDDNEDRALAAFRKGNEEGGD